MTKLDKAILKANKRNEKLFGISLKIPQYLKDEIYQIAMDNKLSVNSLIVEVLKEVFIVEDV